MIGGNQARTWQSWLARLRPSDEVEVNEVLAHGLVEDIGDLVVLMRYYDLSLRKDGGKAFVRVDELIRGLARREDDLACEALSAFENADDGTLRGLVATLFLNLDRQEILRWLGMCEAASGRVFDRMAEIIRSRLRAN